jgi:drug/metabolite transporter (DMT)-like permease
MSAAFVWALAATFAAGIQVFSQKIVAQEKRDSALNGTIGFGISTVITGIAFIMFPSVPEGWHVVVAISLCAGVMMCVAAYYRIESLKEIDSVIYFPINKVIGPLVAVLIGVTLLHETLSTPQMWGIAFSVLVPLLLISSSERHRQGNLRRGLLLLLVSTILTAITAPLQKVVTNISSELLFPLLTWQIAATVSSALLYQWIKPPEASLLRIHARDLKLGFLNGVLQFFSAFAFIKAISLGQVSIFYVIHAHYILIPIILSVLFYGDHINMRKFAAIVISLSAISLLAI